MWRVRATAGVIGPSWASNAAGTTTTSVFVLGVGVRAAAAAFRVAVEGLGGVVVPAVVDATLAAAVDGVDCLPTAFAPAAFDVLAARPVAGAAAAVDRRRGPPELGAVDPVDVSSAIAFSSSVWLILPQDHRGRRRFLR
jgi:hypothetical protein